jgi:hypothetical protein
VPNHNSVSVFLFPLTVKRPDIVIVDKGFGMRVVLDWTHELN